MRIDLDNNRIYKYALTAAGMEVRLPADSPQAAQGNKLNV